MDFTSQGKIKAKLLIYLSLPLHGPDLKLYDPDKIIATKVSTTCSLDSIHPVHPPDPADTTCKARIKN